MMARLNRIEYGGNNWLTKVKIGYIAKVSIDTLTEENNWLKKQNRMTLSVEDQMKTVKDTRFPKRSEMREFGKVYNGTEDVY